MILTLIRHRKLTIVLIPVGKGEGDDVIARVGDVDLQAVRRSYRKAFYVTT